MLLLLTIIKPLILFMLSRLIISGKQILFSFLIDVSYPYKSFNFNNTTINYLSRLQYFAINELETCLRIKYSIVTFLNTKLLKSDYFSEFTCFLAE